MDDATISSLKKLRQYRRLLERECGVVKMKITESASHEELTHMLDDFLYLERSGWKGRKGTSIAQIKKSMYFHHADSQNG